MTPLLWGLVWLALAIVLGCIVGRGIKLADEAQERSLAKRSGTHPSIRKHETSGPICLLVDRPCEPTCSPGYPTCTA